MELQQLLATGVIVFIAYLMRGISGFGSALIAVPILAHFFPLTLIVPWIATLDFIAGFFLAGSGIKNRNIAWKEIYRLVPTAVLGIGVGIYLLTAVNGDYLLLGLAIFVLIFGTKNLLNLHNKSTISSWWAIPTGIFGGGLGALFSTGGPPYVVYLTHRIHDKTSFRSTLSMLFTIDGSFRIGTFLLAGLLIQPYIATYLLISFPIMFVGLYIGHHLHIGLSQRQVSVIIACLLIASGFSLLIRVLG